MVLVILNVLDGEYKLKINVGAINGLMLVMPEEICEQQFLKLK